MELSINTIALFVIALSVLGLGLGLITGVLGVGSDYFSQAIEGYSLDISASSSDRLVVSSPLQLKDVKSNVVLVSYFNAGNDDCDTDLITSGTWLTLECKDMDLHRIQTIPLDIPSGTAKTVGMIVDRIPSTTPGTYVCNINVYCENFGTYALYTDALENLLLEFEPEYSESLFVEVS